MKVLAVSDRVQEHIYSPAIRARHGDVKMVFGCGDVPYYYLEYIVTMLSVPLLYVRGNHDQPVYMSGGRIATHAEGCLDVHGRVVFQSGLLVAGIEGSMRYRPRAPHMYSETEMRGQIARLVPQLLWNRQRTGRYLDVLVAHSPPYGIHDRDDLPHTGFKVFLQFMRLFKPRYLLHGHIHLYRRDTVRQTRVGETEVINVYPYQLLDIPLVG